MAHCPCKALRWFEVRHFVDSDCESTAWVISLVSWLAVGHVETFPWYPEITRVVACHFNWTYTVIKLYPMAWTNTDAIDLTYSSLGGGDSNIVLFSPPSLWKWSNWTNIFQMGWNHQLDHDRITPSISTLSGTWVSETNCRWSWFYVCWTLLAVASPCFAASPNFGM